MPKSNVDTTRFKFTQYILVRPDGCQPWVDRLVTRTKLTMQRAARYYENTHSLDWGVDLITFIDEPDGIYLFRTGHQRKTK